MRLLSPKLLSLLLALAPAGALMAQDDASKRAFYLVEAIVFTHAGGQSDSWPVDEPADYSAARDPKWRSFARVQEGERRRNERIPVDSEMKAALNMVETIASIESGERSLTEALLYPEPWLALDELSEPMVQALNRLEQSGAYQVRARLAWHQPVEGRTGNPAVRIHDERLVAVDWVTLSPTGRLLRDGRPVETAAGLAPALHYRLDGSIRLRQRQFMHADVTLDWRVPETVGPSPSLFAPFDAALQVHRLEQSRAIRPDRLEYFDSAWLGLLLRVTPYEFEPAEPDPGEETGTP